MYRLRDGTTGEIASREISDFDRASQAAIYAATARRAPIEVIDEDDEVRAQAIPDDAAASG